MNIRINDKGGKVISAAMDNGGVVKLHSGLKAAALVLLDIWKQEYGDQSYESFKEQLIAGLDFMHDQK